MKKIITAITLFIISAAAFAQTKDNITKAKVSFEIKNLGIKTGGNIGGVQGTIAFNPANLAESNINATADINTIDTDNNMRNEHLKKEEYFNADAFPKLTLSSVNFKNKGGNNYTGQFNLTIKGHTKLVEIPFTYATLTNGSFFKGRFKINRKDFGVGGNSLTMGNEVTIKFEAESGR